MAADKPCPLLQPSLVYTAEGLPCFDEQCHRYQQKEKNSDVKHELFNLFIKVESSN